MRLDDDLDKQVAGGRAADARSPLPSQTQRLAVFDASRDAHGQTALAWRSGL